MSETLSLEKARANNHDQRYWQSLISCPLCAHDKFHVVVMARDRHYGNAGAFPVVECEACRLWFLNPMPTIEYLGGAYPKTYYSYQSKSRKKISAVKKMRKIIRHLIGYGYSSTGDPKFSRPGTMLDIGCGTGTFLQQMQEKGWDVHGVELSAQAADIGRQQGLDIFGGTIDEASYPSSTFDYVRSNHSFEHIHNPREVLREVHRILKPGGRLFIGVPNVKGLMSRLYGTYWWYLGAPVHTFGYSPATLRDLLAQEGFRVIKVNYNSTFAGVFGSLQIILNRRNGKSSEDGWVINNIGMRILGHWIASWIDFFHAGDCMEVIAEPLPGTEAPASARVLS